MANNFKEAGILLFASWNINLEEVPIEQLDHYIAVENFLTEKDEPLQDAPPIKQVRGYLEAFHHLCEVEDWERGSKVLFTRLDTPSKEELHCQLQTWGYDSELIGLYNKMLGKLSLNQEVVFSISLGRSYSALALYRQAIKYYQQGLAIAQKIGDRNREGIAIGNLGVVYRLLGDYHQAIDYQQQRLILSRANADRVGEASVMGNLGNI
ncbi:tetratricopeptide repeat protein, partial [Scytonema hofmannii]